MSDLIYRQAAIDAAIEAVDDWDGGTNIGRQKRIEKYINALPSAQPVEDIHREKEQAYYCGYEEGAKAARSAQPGWIPWDSGRFPEESGTYTVTAYDGATKRVTYAKYQKRLKRWKLTGARAYWRVLAWMEKPKPWERDANDT